LHAAAYASLGGELCWLVNPAIAIVVRGAPMIK
jgi:hypothetical protein